MVSPKYYDFNPDYAVPPGITLLETLENIGMTQAELAERTGRPKKTINEIINGKSAITPETAIQLEMVLGVPATFWNNLERNYREKLAEEQERERLKESLSWLKCVPIRKMSELGWIKTYDDKIKQLQEVLNFFGVASVKAWEAVWKPFMSSPRICYRKSEAFESDPIATAAWIRKGEIEAQKMNCFSYDLNKFRNSLDYVKTLTNDKPKDFISKMKLACAEAGVAVVFVPELPKCRVNGITRWLSPEKAIIQLSLRYRSDDHLWFTFFHEAGHILYHRKKDIFLEVKGESNGHEDQAKQFAAEFLVPSSALKRFLREYVISEGTVRTFAESLGIAPGIVVGRLQFEGTLPFNSNLNKMKRRFEWASPTD